MALYLRNCSEVRSNNCPLMERRNAASAAINCRSSVRPRMAYSGMVMPVIDNNVASDNAIHSTQLGFLPIDESCALTENRRSDSTTSSPAVMLKTCRSILRMTGLPDRTCPPPAKRLPLTDRASPPIAKRPMKSFGRRMALSAANSAGP